MKITYIKLLVVTLAILSRVTPLYGQRDTMSRQIRDFYVRYMKSIEDWNPQSLNDLEREFLTAEMKEKKGRLIDATGADPLIRAQDISDYGMNSLQCRHLEGAWYEVSYRWAESDTTGIRIPVRIQKDAKGRVRIAYVTPYWAGNKYGDQIFDIPNPEVQDEADGMTFVESFFQAYVYPYVKMSPTLEQDLERLRRTFCTSPMLWKYADMERQSIEDEGPIDPMIGCADFDAFWYPSLKVTSEGNDRYLVSYNTGDQDIQIIMTAKQVDGKQRICDLEIEP